jgi:hypothetical protein
MAGYGPDNLMTIFCVKRRLTRAEFILSEHKVGIDSPASGACLQAGWGVITSNFPALLRIRQSKIPNGSAFHPVLTDNKNMPGDLKLSC